MRRELLNYAINKWEEKIETNNFIGFFYDNKNMYFIHKNTYIYFTLLYKNLMLKDFCNINHRDLLNFYEFNLYKNIKECRLYYIFYFILLRNEMFFYIDDFYENYFDFELIEQEKKIKKEEEKNKIIKESDL
jgi:hypothetical protein